jgi:hypothetical protein
VLSVYLGAQEIALSAPHPIAVFRLMEVMQRHPKRAAVAEYLLKEIRGKSKKFRRQSLFHPLQHHRHLQIRRAGEHVEGDD